MGVGELLYGKGFGLAELIAHYEALIGPVDELSNAEKLRAQIIDELHGTEFDEHAYIYADAATLANQPAGDAPGDAQGGAQAAPDLWPHGAVPTAPPWQS